MAVRKIFSDNDDTELTYRVIDGKLSIEIIEPAGVMKIILDYPDAVQFISELNRVKKLLAIP